MAVDPSALGQKSVSWHDIKQPSILLVRPQLGENIGMCARAMLNCGLTELVIVAPRDGWPNANASAAAAGADAILEKAKLYETLEEAAADFHLLIATTNRTRESVKPVFTAESAARHCQQALSKGEHVGIVFGPERTGLENEDMALCGAVLTVPLNPGFSSLNLAQAVLIAGYEWAKLTRFSDVKTVFDPGESEWATLDELNFFLTKLDEQLEANDFYRTKEMKPSVLGNIKTMFARNRWTSQELQTLHGMISALTGARKKS